jgi:DNA polymerase III subunit beta
MKIIAKAGELAEALALADLLLTSSDTTVRKNQMLSAVRITAADTTVSFTLDILDRAVVVKAATEVIEPGEVAVPLKALTGLMTGCAPDTIVSLRAAGKAMTVTAGKGHFRLPMMPIADMPVVPVIEPENEIELETTAFMSLLRVMSAASNEQTRYYLCGILLHTVDRHLIACATDGHRLMRAAVLAAFFSRDYSCIVPLPTAAVIEKLVKRTKPDTIKIKRARTLLVFETPDIVFTTKLIDATYPDYTRVIPETAKNTVTIDSNELIAALNRLAAVAAKESVPLVALHWQEDGNLDLSLARAPSDAHDIVEAETAGAVRVAVPLGQLLYLIEQIGADTLHLSADGTSPIVIKPVGDDSLLGVQTICAWNFSLHQAAA